MKSLFVEAVLVAIVGAAIALVANQVSPRGLKLTRDYFYSSRAASAATNAASPGFGSSPTNGAAAAVIGRLREKGIAMADGEHVGALFRDSRYQQGLIVFIDARDDANFQSGHIPGAYQLDYYRPEKYLPEVLQAAQLAEQIVIYCAGGTCEDSEFAAQLLAGAVPPQKLLVYPGGMAEWLTNGMPVEVGPRGSGVIRTGEGKSR